MAVSLSRNMLLKPEKEGLPGSEALMKTPDDSLQGGDTGGRV
jgi:hypothetical protein